MQYIIRQKILAIRDRFTIKDINDNDVFQVKGSLLAIPKRLKVMDMQGNELIQVRHKIIDIMPQFFIIKDGEKIAKVKRRFTLRKKYAVHAKDGEYAIEGDVWAWNYNILKDGKKIYIETVEFTLLGNNFSGTDDFIIEHYNEENKLIKKDEARYSVAGVRISGQGPN